MPFSPVSGARFLVAYGRDEPSGSNASAQALERDLQGQRSFERPRQLLSARGSRSAAEVGFHTRVGLQYHWHNDGYETFEDYLGAFRSKRRNQVRRERREMEKQGVTIRTYTGDDITED